MATDWKRRGFRTKGFDSLVLLSLSLHSYQPTGSLGIELHSQASGLFAVPAWFLRSITTINLDVWGQRQVEGFLPVLLNVRGRVCVCVVGELTSAQGCVTF